MSDQDRLTLEMVLGPGKRNRARKVTVACVPAASDAAMAAIEAVLPSQALIALPLGTYRFEIDARHGFRTAALPDGASSEAVRAVEDAVFEVMRRLYGLLVEIHDVLFDADAVPSAVDGLYAATITTAIDTRSVATLKPGFLLVQIGTEPKLYESFAANGVDEDSVDALGPFGVVVVTTNDARYLALVSVCADEHPFAAYAVAAFGSRFEALARARERDAVKVAQRSLERELVELQDDRRLFAAAFGELSPDDLVGSAPNAVMMSLSGVTGEA